MAFNELVYKTEVKEGKVQIPLTFIEKAQAKGLAIEVVTPEGSTYITPIDYPSDDLDDVPYQIMSYDFQKVDTSLSKWEEQLLTKFHYNWFNLLRDLLQESNFKPILQKVNDDRKEHKIYPSKENMLKPFAFDPEGIRVIFVGSNPKASELGLWDLNYFDRLTARGYWWINVNMTEFEDIPFQHSEWEPFIRATIERLNKPIVVTDQTLLPVKGATVAINLTIDTFDKFTALL